MSPSVPMIARSAFDSPPAIARVVLAVGGGEIPGNVTQRWDGVVQEMVERVEQAGRPV
jgi:hypothetical protein